LEGFNFKNFNQSTSKQKYVFSGSLRNIGYRSQKKKYTIDQVNNSYKKIMKKIHPDRNPELNRLATIVNEAKEIVIKNLV
jgi:DnaJ domain.